MKCTHLDALPNRVGIERVSQTAEAVFSFAHRPVLGVAQSIVPRCMEPDCARPVCGNMFVCVQCVYYACNTPCAGGLTHVERHLAERKHAIYLSVEHGRMYCARCKDFVFHPFLDSAIELQKRISLGARRNFFTSASPLDDSIAAVIMDPNESLRRVRSKRRRLMATQHWAPTKHELTVLNKHSMPPARGRIDPLPPFGLYNLGNSCYMNSVLQAFLNAPPLRCYFLSDDHRPNCTYTPKSDCLACAMDKMICDAYSGYRLPAKGAADSTGNTSDAKAESPFLVPQRVFEIIWRNADHLATYAQHDAHEFLIAALNVLNTHCRRSSSNAPSPVKPKLLTTSRKRQLASDPASPVANVRGGVDGTFGDKVDPTAQSTSIVKTLFSGTLQSDVICRVCGNWSPTLEKFYDVSLDVDKMPRPQQPTRRSRASSPAVGAVAESLNASRNSRGSKSEERKAGGKPAAFVDPAKQPGGDMQGANTLFECLSRFTEPEMLGASSKMFCRACGKREEAMKQMSIRSLPSIVSFHFKRFEQSFARIRRSEMVKIDTPVEFPVDGLDLSPFQTSAVLRKRKMVPSSGAKGSADGTETAQVTVPPYTSIPTSKSILRPTSDALYDLFAVVNHNGTIDSGHYTTLVRRNGDWYKCDDDKVHKVAPITSKSLQSKEAYLVFYVQRTPNLQY